MVRKRILTLLGALVIPATLLLAPIALLSGTADSATAARGSLPPSARKDLVAIFGQQVRELVLCVTRAALVDRMQERNPQLLDRCVRLRNQHESSRAQFIGQEPTRAKKHMQTDRYIATTASLRRGNP